MAHLLIPELLAQHARQQRADQTRLDYVGEILYWHACVLHSGEVLHCL